MRKFASISLTLILLVVMTLIFARLNNSIKELGQPVEPVRIEKQQTTEDKTVLHVTATAYCSCPKCCGKWADGYTYTGTKATQNRTIAVDPKVIPLGSKVLIDGQIYIAEDTGSAIKGNRVDVYFESHSEALKWGRQKIIIEVM